MGGVHGLLVSCVPERVLMMVDDYASDMAIGVCENRLIALRESSRSKSSVLCVAWYKMTRTQPTAGKFRLAKVERCSVSKRDAQTTHNGGLFARVGDHCAALLYKRGLNSYSFLGTWNVGGESWWINDGKILTGRGPFPPLSSPPTQLDRFHRVLHLDNKHLVTLCTRIRVVGAAGPGIELQERCIMSVSNVVEGPRVMPSKHHFILPPEMSSPAYEILAGSIVDTAPLLDMPIPIFITERLDIYAQYRDRLKKIGTFHSVPSAAAKATAPKNPLVVRNWSCNMILENRKIEGQVVTSTFLIFMMINTHEDDPQFRGTKKWTTNALMLCQAARIEVKTIIQGSLHAIHLKYIEFWKSQPGVDLHDLRFKSYDSRCVDSRLDILPSMLAYKHEDLVIMFDRKTLRVLAKGSAVRVPRDGIDSPALFKPYTAAFAASIFTSLPDPAVQVVTRQIRLAKEKRFEQRSKSTFKPTT
jgi:hypothetical protein